MNIKISDYFKNPIIIFATVCILLTLWVLFVTKFQMPERYIDFEQANAIAQNFGIGSKADNVDNAVKHLLNPRYDFCNNLLYYWGWVIACFVFILIFKINDFRKFKQLELLNKKIFAYLWINLSFIIFEFFYVTEYILDLHKYAYSWAWDSWSIPFFTQTIMQVLIAAIFYPFLNFLVFMTFNLKTKNIFYIILWLAVFIYWVLMALACSALKFTYLHLYLDFHFIVWLIFIFYSIGFIKQNRTQAKRHA